ncbi:hypothetical protein MJO28_015003, partial [Puccinia striiformis f. sp. tritici]
NHPLKIPNNSLPTLLISTMSLRTVIVLAASMSMMGNSTMPMAYRLVTSYPMSIFVNVIRHVASGASSLLLSSKLQLIARWSALGVIALPMVLVIPYQYSSRKWSEPSLL